MTLASDIAADLSGVFLTDFAVTVTATTWGTTPKAIFDEDLFEFNDVSSVAPQLLMRNADIPDTYTSGDLFVVSGINYKLVDVQYADPDMKRVFLALV